MPLCTGSKRARVEETTAESSFADESYDVSVAYVCELPEVKGRFDIEKARKFFNRPGPHYGLLQSGKSVLASDGVTMVRYLLWTSCDHTSYPILLSCSLYACSLY